MEAVDWESFEAQQPELAAHAEERLTAGVSYLSTVREDGFPRVHPVGLHVRDGQLLVPMLKTSPKGRDLERTGRYAAHCTVEDNMGGGGEVLVTGLAERTTAPADFAERGWIAFRLRIAEVQAVRHTAGSGQPSVTRWQAS
ncbi:MAG TPA: pyridoxamine 5'-phosphate oxidase family protein [Acidimicrobiales bacterium]|nr:pyridoxamine 5'-phosphate oxidase family protein [Acidimicrobiales bacterium]